MTERKATKLKVGFYGILALANLTASWFIGSKLGQHIGELIVGNND